MNEMPTKPVSLTSVLTGTITRFIFCAAAVHSSSEIGPSVTVLGGVKVRSSW